MVWGRSYSQASHKWEVGGVFLKHHPAWHEAFHYDSVADQGALSCAKNPFGGGQRRRKQML